MHDFFDLLPVFAQIPDMLLADTRSGSSDSKKNHWPSGRIKCASCKVCLLLQLQTRREQMRAWTKALPEPTCLDQNGRQSGTNPHYRWPVGKLSVWAQRYEGEGGYQLSQCHLLWQSWCSQEIVRGRNKPGWDGRRCHSDRLYRNRVSDAQFHTHWTTKIGVTMASSDHNVRWTRSSG